MSNPKDIEQQIRNAPRLGPDLRPVRDGDLRPTDRQGGFFPTSSPGKPRGNDGAPGVPASGGTAERLPGFNDRQVRPSELPTTADTPRPRR
jgi:hypothetical protein